MMAWSVGLIVPNKELLCHIDLERLGIVSYLPLGSRPTKPKRKKKPVRTTYFPFPGYIFIKDARQHALLFKHVRGFRRIVIERIQDKHVDLVRRRQDDGGFDIDRLGVGRKKFNRGDRVRVTLGPMLGVKGTVRYDTRGKHWAFIDTGYGMIKIFVDFVAKDE